MRLVNKPRLIPTIGSLVSCERRWNEALQVVHWMQGDRHLEARKPAPLGEREHT